MFGIGAPELLIILLIVLLLFGGKKLPELSRSLGEAVKEFKKGMSLDEKSSSKKKNEKDAKTK